MKLFFRLKDNIGLSIALIMAALYALMSILQVGCIFRRFFGIICPGCYMTRAALALLKFDFKAAFCYHPMVFAMPVLAVYLLCDCKVFKIKWLDNAVLWAIGIGFAVCYILRLNGLI